MYTTKQTMAERLVSAKLALTNALAEEDVREALKELGFDEARLQAGLDLYHQAEELYQVQKKEYSDQFQATEAVFTAWQEARVVHQKYVTVARLALMGHPGLKNSLGLNEDQAFSISDWLTQARLFYTAALKSPEIQDKLKEFAVTAEKLQAGLALVDRLESLNSQQEVEKGEAQQASRDRDAAFAALDKFMYAFNQIARLLLTEKPEHLEKLGILERSAPLPKPKSPPTTPPQPQSSPPPE